MDLTELLTPTLPVGELIFRGSITFLLLYLLIRIVGRREFGAVGLTDVLVIVRVADAASTGMTGQSERSPTGSFLSWSSCSGASSSTPWVTSSRDASIHEIRP